MQYTSGLNNCIGAAAAAASEEEGGVNSTSTSPLVGLPSRRIKTNAASHTRSTGPQRHLSVTASSGVSEEATEASNESDGTVEEDSSADNGYDSEVANDAAECFMRVCERAREKAARERAEREVAAVEAVIADMLEETVDEVVEGMVGAPLHTCVVCYEEARPSQTETTPCAHTFCKACLQRVRETRPFCPLCRARIGEDPPVSFPTEDSVLRLLVRLLTVADSSATASAAAEALGNETRRILMDLVLGLREGGNGVGGGGGSRPRFGGGGVVEEESAPEVPPPSGARAAVTSSGHRSLPVVRGFQLMRRSSEAAPAVAAAAAGEGGEEDAVR
eukprot:Rhum_TRINITY_DN484_c0_g1::Rhum_TRINITY_DN484_c0_g1_i1::g.1463::m.1463